MKVKELIKILNNFEPNVEIHFNIIEVLNIENREWRLRFEFILQDNQKFSQILKHGAK